MEKSYHMYEDIAPVMANYSRAVRVGDFFFITGTTAGGSAAAQGDMAAQLRETLDRIRRILEREGLSITDVVKFNTYVTSISEWQEHGAEDQRHLCRALSRELPRAYAHRHLRAGGDQHEGRS